MLAPPGPVTVNVEVLMVAGFIGLLKVALTTAVFGQTPTLPFGGVTTVTVGGLVGEEGVMTAPLSGSLHPASEPSSRSARKQIVRFVCVRI
jgi:hypothetical protein